MFNKTKTIKYGKVALAKIKNNLAGSAYLLTGWPVPRPTKFYYLISNKCNFRCQMCPQWQTGHKEAAQNYIGEDRVKSIVKQMADLKIAEFGISGGEPLLFPDKVLNLLAYANQLGLYTHFATNGSLLGEKFLEQYDDCGGGHVSLSLDALGENHDRLRGHDGAYEGVSRVIKIFKENNFKNIILKINVVISDANLDQVMDVVTLAGQAGAVVFVQPYDPYDYGGASPADKEKKYELWVKKTNHARLRRLADDLLNYQRGHPGVILNSRGHLKNIYDYFTADSFSTRCAAPLDQITMDPFGNVIFCKFGSIANLYEMSLKDYINGPIRKKIIKAALTCNQGCLLGCMFKPGLLDLLKDGSRQFIKLIQ